MPDIVIYTSEETLKHKRGEGELFWAFKRFPKWLNDCKRIFFAVEGYVVGSFNLDDFDVDEKEIYWRKEMQKKAAFAKSRKELRTLKKHE